MTTRRQILSATAAAALYGCSRVAPTQTKLRRIATEEGWSCREVLTALGKQIARAPEEDRGLAYMLQGGAYPDWPQLLDPEPRLADMDGAGIDVQLLLLSSPGVQVFEPDEAIDLSRLVNDRLHEWTNKWPDRFAALAAVPVQAPDAAAQELERAVKTLGLKGAVINSHTKSQYLDDRKFWPVLEAAEALEVPIYLHPREPSNNMVDPYLDYGLQGAIWGYAAETSLHALRMILGGVFDQFPRLRIVLGHLGEGIPFYLDRIDNRYRAMNRGGLGALKKPPSEYFRENFFVTTSGSNWPPAVRFCQNQLGVDKVLFAVDYPFEKIIETVAQSETIEMSNSDKRKFYELNAVSVFNL